MGMVFAPVVGVPIYCIGFRVTCAWAFLQPVMGGPPPFLLSPLLSLFFFPPCNFQFCFKCQQFVCLIWFMRCLGYQTYCWPWLRALYLCIALAMRMSGVMTPAFMSYSCHFWQMMYWNSWLGTYTAKREVRRDSLASSWQCPT